MADEKKEQKSEPKSVSFGDKTQRRGTIVCVIIVAVSVVFIVIGLIGLFAKLRGN